LFDPSSQAYAAKNTSTNTIPGLLALHIRRGDFESHCKYLFRASQHYNAFNSFPELPDHLVIPSDKDEATKKAIHKSHCYPTIPEIVAKVRVVRKENPGLRNIFLMTNGKAGWIAELTDALMSDGLQWDAIHSTRELELTWEEKYVDQAVDMLIAQKAEVFVGNGVSLFLFFLVKVIAEQCCDSFLV
jgi:hypothetical protein